MFLLIANRELALSLLVGSRKGIKCLDCLARQNWQGEFRIGFGIFVTRLRDEGCQLRRCLESWSIISCARGLGNSHKPWYRLAEMQGWCSTPCASPRQFPRKICHNLGRTHVNSHTQQFTYSYWTLASRRLPPWNRVSPVNTALSSPSCIK